MIDDCAFHLTSAISSLDMLNIFRKQPVEFCKTWIIFQELQVLFNGLLIIAAGRTGLYIQRIVILNFTNRFIDQRFENFKRETIALQKHL